MANRDTPNGFKPVRYLNGSPYNGAHNLYHKLATTAEALFIGDIVQLSGTAGLVGVQVNGVDVEGMPGILDGAVSSDVLGVVVGFYTDPDALGTKYSPASTAAIVMVADDPYLIFEIHEDSVGTSFAAVDVGRHVDTIAMLDGNTDTGISSLELDSSVASVTTTAMVQLLRLVPRAGNAIGTNARWEVRFIEHTFLSDTPSIGV